VGGVLYAVRARVARRVRVRARPAVHGPGAGATCLLQVDTFSPTAAAGVIVVVSDQRHHRHRLGPFSFAAAVTIGLFFVAYQNLTGRGLLVVYFSR